MATTMPRGASEATDIAGKASAFQTSAKQAVESDNIPAAISSFEQLRATAPNNADILSNIGKFYYMSGNLDAAIKFFSDSAVAAPENEAFKANHIAVLGMSAGQNVAEGNCPEAFALLRTALAYDPGNPGCRVDLANALEFFGIQAELGDYIPNAAPEQLGTHLLITCMPKSGSTFLKKTLCKLTG